MVVLLCVADKHSVEYETIGMVKVRLVDGYVSVATKFRK